MFSLAVHARGDISCQLIFTHLIRPCNVTYNSAELTERRSPPPPNINSGIRTINACRLNGGFALDIARRLLKWQIPEGSQRLEWPKGNYNNQEQHIGLNTLMYVNSSSWRCKYKLSKQSCEIMTSFFLFLQKK